MNVPKLRFKEFNDEWKKIKLSDISNITMGQSPDSNNYTTDKNDIILIQGNADLNNGIVSPRIFTTQVTKQCYIGDIIMTVRAPVGDVAISNYNACIGRGVCAIKGSKFIYHYLKYLKEKEYWKKISKGSTIDSITSNDIKELEIKIPLASEENKIIKFMDLLDKKIELQSKKIEALKLYKKRLIDHLVSKMNIVNSKKLSQLGYTYNGLSGKSKEDFVDGNCKFITFMSVLKNNISENLFSTVKIKEKEKQNKVLKGDLFFTGSSETKEEVGMVSTLNYDFDDLYLNSFCFGFRLNLLDEINNNFLCNLLLSSKYRKIISNLGQGFTRVNISKKELLGIDIEYPDYDYQLRIANTLNNMYSKIKLEEEKITKLEALKKGLMQNMFV